MVLWLVKTELITVVTGWKRGLANLYYTIIAAMCIICRIVIKVTSCLHVFKRYEACRIRFDFPTDLSIGTNIGICQNIFLTLRIYHVIFVHGICIIREAVVGIFCIKEKITFCRIWSKCRRLNSQRYIGINRWVI